MSSGLILVIRVQDEVGPGNIAEFDELATEAASGLRNGSPGARIVRHDPAPDSTFRLLTSVVGSEINAGIGPGKVKEAGPVERTNLNVFDRFRVRHGGSEDDDARNRDGGNDRRRPCKCEDFSCSR